MLKSIAAIQANSGIRLSKVGKTCGKKTKNAKGRLNYRKEYREARSHIPRFAYCSLYHGVLLSDGEKCPGGR